jgi:hypothetical protein
MMIVQNSLLQNNITLSHMFHTINLHTPLFTLRYTEITTMKCPPRV